MCAGEACARSVLARGQHASKSRVIEGVQWQCEGEQERRDCEKRMAMTERVNKDSVSQGIVSSDNVKGGNESAGSMRS